MLYDGACSGFVNEQPNMVISNNYWEDLGEVGGRAALAFRNLGSLAYYDNNEIAYNTFNKTACLEAINSNDATIGTTNILNFHHNICLDDRGTAYPADGTDGLMRIGYYGSDAQYTSSIAKLVFNNNDYWNSAGTALYFTLFGGDAGGYGPAGTAGDDYTGLAAWKLFAQLYDAASLNIDPVLNGDQIATAVGTTGMGWNVNYFQTAASDTTPVVTGGKGAVISNGKHRRIKAGKR